LKNVDFRMTKVGFGLRKSIFDILRFAVVTLAHANEEKLA